MTDPLIPASTRIAAKRGFIRSTAQAYSTALAGGITIAAVTDAVSQVAAGNWVPLSIALGVTLVSPLLTGAASFFDLLYRGLPGDYVDAAVDKRIREGV